MVDKVARLHFQPASPAGALRALSGWLIAITGLALLVAQLVRSVDGFALPVSGADAPTVLAQSSAASPCPAISSASSAGSRSSPLER